MARPETYRAIREQDRRDKISITKHLNKLADIQKDIDELCAERWEGLFYEDGEPANLRKAIDAGRIGAMRLNADISLRLLNKRLPDLKAIEHSGSIGDKRPEEMDESELAAELTKVRELIAGSAAKTKIKQKPARVH